jgi:hypothetical protein
VWVGKRPTIRAGVGGIQLQPGQSVTYKHYKGDVWAISDQTGPTTVSSQEE